eukprot:265734_1
MASQYVVPVTLLNVKVILIFFYIACEFGTIACLILDIFGLASSIYENIEESAEDAGKAGIVFCIWGFIWWVGEALSRCCGCDCDEEDEVVLNTITAFTVDLPLTIISIFIAITVKHKTIITVLAILSIILESFVWGIKLIHIALYVFTKQTKQTKVNAKLALLSFASFLAPVGYVFVEEPWMGLALLPVIGPGIITFGNGSQKKPTSKKFNFDMIQRNHDEDVMMDDYILKDIKNTKLYD